MLFFKIPAALGACLPGKGGESLGPSQGECVRTGAAQAHRRCVGERAGLLWIEKSSHLGLGQQPRAAAPAGVSLRLRLQGRVIYIGDDTLCQTSRNIC